MNRGRNEQNRYEWVKTQLSQLPSGQRLLDAGAGEQQYRNLCSHLRYVSQDFAQYKPESDPTGLQMQTWNYPALDIVCDIISIPEKDGSFDAVLCTEVLEHIPDPVKAIHELSRLLRTGGTMLLTAPFCSLTHFAPFHFSTGFNRFFYEHHLKEAGFEITELQINGNYFAWLDQELGRLPEIMSKYSDQSPGRIDYQAISRVRKMLNIAEAKDKGSEELLSFGIHIRAVKSA
ncbi:MAG: class I SAM-dependent methyltransferase [Bacteroidia bacterium]|nr:class I SAM-dependent methyltransferase [Bacteroidia bacterium]